MSFEQVSNCNFIQQIFFNKMKSNLIDSLELENNVAMRYGNRLKENEYYII